MTGLILGSFLLKYGFVSKVNGVMEFSMAKKCRIFNLNEMNFSLDGNDGGQGGHPAIAVTINGVSQPAMAINKMSISSILRCGSNAAEEALPLHIMFSSDAENVENCSVSAEWIFDLPHVYVQYGHDSNKSFPATVTVNSKGGTDSCVLMLFLFSDIEWLYPDAKEKLVVKF